MPAFSELTVATVRRYDSSSTGGDAFDTGKTFIVTGSTNVGV